MTNTASELNYVELARQIAARMSPEALLSAEDVGAMLGYPARYIRETIALALGFPVAIRLRLDSDGKRSIQDGDARTLKTGSRPTSHNVEHVPADPVSRPTCDTPAVPKSASDQKSDARLPCPAFPDFTCCALLTPK